MSTYHEIHQIRKRGAVLRYVVLGIVALAITFGALKYGNELGYKAGWQDAMVSIQKAVADSKYPTVYLTYPGKQAAEIVSNGVCTPYPAHVPQFYHFGGYVSPRWMPCATQHYAQPTAMSPALAAITRAVQR